MTLAQGTAEILSVDDAEQILQVCDLAGLDIDLLSQELRLGSGIWSGVRNEDGDLVAVHRSLAFDKGTLLRGVWVTPSLRGSHAVLSMAFCLRRHASREGVPVFAWAAARGPDRLIADRLRLRPVGVWEHRYLLPFKRRSTAPEVWPDGGELGLSASPFAHDRSRALFVQTLCESTSNLEQLRGEVESTRATAIDELEFGVSAADIASCFWLGSLGAKRLSEKPVRLHQWDGDE